MTQTDQNQRLVQLKGGSSRVTLALWRRSKRLGFARGGCGGLLGAGWALLGLDPPAMALDPEPIHTACSHLHTHEDTQCIRICVKWHTHGSMHTWADTNAQYAYRHAHTCGYTQHVHRPHTRAACTHILKCTVHMHARTAQYTEHTCTDVHMHHWAQAHTCACACACTQAQ